MTNRYGETLEQCQARLVREKVTPEVAARYALDVARSFENLHNEHNANFYRMVAENLTSAQATS